MVFRQTMSFVTPAIHLSDASRRGSGPMPPVARGHCRARTTAARDLGEKTLRRGKKRLNSSKEISDEHGEHARVSTCLSTTTLNPV